MSGKRASLREHRTGRRAKVSGFVREDRPVREGRREDRKVYSRKDRHVATDVLHFDREVQ